MSSSIGASDAINKQKLEKLLVQQAEIQAQIASLLPSSTHQQRSPIHKQSTQQRRKDNVPRTVSSTAMARHASDQIKGPSQPSRSISQRSAPSMTRTNSIGSTSARSGPFVQTGIISPLLTNNRQENPAIEAWTIQEAPLTSYTFSHQPHESQRSTIPRKTNLEHVSELENVGEDPAAFLSREGCTPTFSFTQPSITVQTTTPRNQLPSLNTQQTYNIYTPTTPTSDSQSLTNATTLTSNSMSRQNSLYNEPILESIEMMKFNSNTSFSNYPIAQSLYDQATPHCTSSRHSRRSSNEEQAQLLVGAGGAGNNSHFSHTFASQEKYPLFQSSGSFGEKMEKSQSNESTSSTSSSVSSRSKQSLRASIELAASRRLMPKGMSEGQTMSRDNSLQSMTRLESKDGSQDKIAISKPVYQRPKHDRVYCKQCDDHAEGFRGEHELRRHQDRQHKTRVKKWICTLPSPNSEQSQSTLKPAFPLNRCKSCQFRKQYGAYYNAAAHLRRAHFKPKSKGRSKNHSKLDLSTKRGGNGGGNWPTMEELKSWMTEVEVDVVPADYTLTPAQHAEAEAEVDADASDDETYADDLSPASANIHSHMNLNMNIPMSMSISGSGNSGFENSYLVPDAAFATYPSPSTADLYMHYLDTTSQPQTHTQTSTHTSPQTTINTSLALSSQQTYDAYDFNDTFPSSFDTTIPSFDDQLVGLENVYSFPSSIV